jgi:malonyl CoA-acyl carrier protein transacylase/phosphopantetheinyl transferase
MSARTELVVLQADTADALRTQALQLAGECAERPSLPLAELAAAHLPVPVTGGHRLVAVATDVADLGRLLVRAVEGGGGGRGRGRAGRSAVHLGHEPVGSHGRIAWLFPGEGSQYAGMLADLCVEFPGARRCFDLLDRAVATDPPPSRLIFPVGPTDGGRDGEDALWSMGGAVASVLTANRAVASVLRTLGLRPDVVVGHSTGEYSALLESGAVDAPDEAGLVEQLRLGDTLSRRLEADGRIPTGTLLATALADEATVAAVLRDHADRAWLALDNCPAQQVVFATAEAAAAVTQELRAAGALVQPLPFGRAYHTPLFSAVDDDLVDVLDRLPLRPPGTEVWSSATAAPYPTDPVDVRRLLLTQWSAPVRFRETVLALHDAGVRVFIEAGPRGNLRQFVADTLAGRSHLAVAADHHLLPGRTQLQHLVAALVAAGVPVDLAPLRPHVPTRDDSPRLVLGLPVLRLSDVPAPAAPAAAPLPAAPAPPPAQAVPAPDRPTLDLRRDPWLRDHALGGRVSEADPGLSALVVVPLTVSVELMARAAVATRPGHPVAAVRDVRAHRWLVVPDGTPLRLTVRARNGPTPGDVHVLLGDEGEDEGPAVEAVVELGPPRLPAPADPFPANVATAYPWRPDELYRQGMFHGPAFQGVRYVDAVSAHGALATVEVPDELPGPPSLTAPMHGDAVGQLVGFWAAAQLTSGYAVFPRRVERIELSGDSLPTGRPMAAGLHVREVTDETVLADLELRDEARRRVWHATGWEDTRARMPAGLLRLRVDPANTWLSETWPWPDADEVTCRRLSLAHRLPASDAAFWLDVVASLVLARGEREEWQRVRRTRRARTWLGGRIAVKDAVRRATGSRCFPADVPVNVDRQGAPHVPLGSAGTGTAVSISHRGPWAVAVAAPGARGVGVDVELVSEQPAELGRAVLSPGEAEACGLGPVQGEAALRLWCAKEASAKALGHGLPAGPPSMVVLEATPDASRVRLTPGPSLVSLDPALAGEQLTARTTRDHDLIAAIARR